jgi:DNA repair exonuclease SbcCD nuclease subunit
MDNDKLRVLFIGDPHFKISNIEEVDIFIDKIINIVKENPVDFCLIAGDILHTHERLNSMVLNKAVYFVENIASLVKTYILVGNHDMYNNKQFLTTGHWMNCMKHLNNAIIVDKVVVASLRNIKIVFVPYVQPGMFETALDTLNDDWKTASCIFAHQEFYGCKMGSIVSEEGDKWMLDYPEVVSGHIHDAQRPQANIYYPGSSMQQSYDNTKNAVSLLTIRSDRPLHIQEIDLCLSKKKIIYLTCKDFYDYDFDIIFKSIDKIKISVSGLVEEYKELRNTKLYKDVSNRIFIVFKKTEETPKNNSAVGEIKDFRKIIKDSILNEKNRYLEHVMEMCM